MKSHSLLLAFALTFATCPTTTPAAPKPPPVSTLPASAALSGKVTAVHDGDTLKVILNGKETAIRLEGIDAPELGQPFGKAAKEALSALVFGKVATITPLEKPDRYGRTLARVFVGVVDVNREMVLQGHAWHFATYSKEAALAGAQKEARAAKRGLWADPSPVPPGEWRKAEKERQAEKRK